MSSTRTLYRLAHSHRSRAVRAALCEFFDARLRDEQRIPKRGGALLVGNHSLFGLDSFPFAALCVTHAGRMPIFLADRNLWSVPLFRRVLDSLGAVPGTRGAAVELLRAGELVCVYPGGIDDSFKRAEQAYQLQWGERAGFAAVALEAGAPLVPFVGEGVDDLISVIAKERWIGRALFGSARYDLPLLRGAWGLPLPLPRRVPLVYHVLEPILAQGDAGRPEDVERLRLTVRERMESVLREVRARRPAAG